MLLANLAEHPDFWGVGELPLGLLQLGPARFRWCNLLICNGFVFGVHCSIRRRPTSHFEGVTRLQDSLPTRREEEEDSGIGLVGLEEVPLSRGVVTP